MTRNSSHSLGINLESFIEREVASGKYSSRLEVMRSAIKLLKDREEKVRSLQSKLIEGEESGFVNNFSPEEHLEELHKKYL